MLDAENCSMLMDGATQLLLRRNPDITNRTV